jgi:nucleotide-binding universal stress UspA family protein
VFRPLHVATGARFRSVDESANDALGLLLAAGRDLEMELDPLVRSGTDIAGEIVRGAREVDADLIVLGWHRPTLSRSLIGGTVASVMRNTSAEVVVHYERHPRPWRRLLVPFLYGEHDRAAVAVAHRLAQHEGEKVTILHVVEPDEDPRSIGPFRESLGSARSEVKVVPAPDPLSATVAEARSGDYDAIIVGTSRAWGMSPSFLSIRHEQLSKDTRASMLIVRAGDD